MFYKLIFNFKPTPQSNYSFVVVDVANAFY